MFKVSQKKPPRTRCQIYSKLAIKTTETTSGASIVNFENISHFILMLLLLNSNR